MENSVNIKKLPLERWMVRYVNYETSDESSKWKYVSDDMKYLREKYPQTDHREFVLDQHAKYFTDGVYKIGKTSFFTHQGRFFVYQSEVDMFDFRLGIFNANELREEEKDALLAIAKTRFATPRQRKMSFSFKKIVT